MYDPQYLFVDPSVEEDILDRIDKEFPVSKRRYAVMNGNIVCVYK
jgi:hypothetical protein